MTSRGVYLRYKESGHRGVGCLFWDAGFLSSVFFQSLATLGISGRGLRPAERFEPLPWPEGLKVGGTRLLQDFENGFHLDGGAGGELRETQCAPGMEAVALLAKDLVEQVGAAVDHQMLVGEIERRVDAAEHLDDPEAIESSVGVPD